MGGWKTAMVGKFKYLKTKQGPPPALSFEVCKFHLYAVPTSDIVVARYGYEYHIRLVQYSAPGSGANHVFLLATSPRLYDKLSSLSVKDIAES